MKPSCVEPPGVPERGQSGPPSGLSICSISARVRQQQPLLPRVAARLTLLIATAILLHLGLERHRHAVIAAMLVIVQLACALILSAGHAGGRMPARLAPLACCLVLPACLLVPRPGVVAALLVSHTALYAGLALFFGSSLRGGREPLVTAMARRMEPVLTRAMEDYTRGVTWLWALYGPAQIVISLLLLAFAPLHDWSVFVNLLDLPLLAAFFMGEYAWRRWHLRGSSRVTLSDTVRAAISLTPRMTPGS